MTEGPQARVSAMLISRRLSGKTVESVYARSRKLRVPIEDLVSKKLNGADSFGKNIVLFIRDYAVRIHPMMYGTLRIIGEGETFGRPEKQVRLKISFGNCLLVGFNTLLIELDYAERIVSALETSLGPDPYKPSWSREAASLRLWGKSDEKVGVAILDQSVIAGIGNILRNEILFRVGINPERKVESLSNGEVELLLEATEDLFKTFLDRLTNGGTVKDLLQVYGRYRGKCPRCGTPIKYYRQEPVRRKTFICPNCQK